ncbi:hypothetical protein AB833_21090 [Chromatiales bacterium (ex Bugula neritina AB1)]|nr:hypothetical protein AB833_21090 [Chromatiales bacterium (ex Bugula neritina AB1)]
MTLPVLYSFRRCPYAIRARLMLLLTGRHVELREIPLKSKPAEMLAASAKGTVPVMVLPDGRVLDESMDIIHWGLKSHPEADGFYGSKEVYSRQLALIERNDTGFKYWLDRYKYHVRFPEYDRLHYRNHAEQFVAELESHLNESEYLFGSKQKLADIAIMPFIRQFSAVDAHWFENSAYSGVRRWLHQMLSSEEFSVAMTKHPEWLIQAPDDSPIVLKMHIG